MSRLSEAWGRYHRENRFLVAVFIFLMVLSVGAFYLLQRAKDSSPEELTNRVLLFVLWYLDISLILIMFLHQVEITAIYHFVILFMPQNVLDVTGMKPFYLLYLHRGVIGYATGKFDTTRISDTNGVAGHESSFYADDARW